MNEEERCEMTIRFSSAQFKTKEHAYLLWSPEMKQNERSSSIVICNLYMQISFEGIKWEEDEEIT